MKQSLRRKVKHFKIPFTVCISTVSEKPNPFKDEMHHFSDSNTIVYKVPNIPNSDFLYMQLKAEQDCILRVTASAHPHVVMKKQLSVLAPSAS